MKYKDMPSVKAKQYARNTVVGYDCMIDVQVVRNRISRAYMAGYDAARKRFSSNSKGKKEEVK